MKKFSKILSVALLVALVLSLGVANAFAATTYSITIDNAVKGETYTAYKIFDVTYSGKNENPGTLPAAPAADNRSEYTAYSYSIANNSEWWTVVVGSAEADANGVYTANGLTFTPSSPAGTYVVTATNGFNAATFAELLNNNKSEKTAAGTQRADSTTVTIDVNPDEAGYYFVDTSLGSLCSLDTTEPSATIREKNTRTTTDKTVKEDSTGNFGDKNDADVGDTVNFKTTVTIGKHQSNVVLHDIMQLDKLAFNYNVEITAPTGVTPVYTICYPAHGNVDSNMPTGNNFKDDTFAVVFDNGWTEGLENNVTLEVTYSAVLTTGALVGEQDDADVGEGNDNQTKVTFGDSQSTEWDYTRTYTWGFDVFKYAGDLANNPTKLAGAKFILELEVPGTAGADPTYKALVFTEVEKGDATKATKYRFDKAGTDASGATATELVTPASGLITIEGLDADTYRLTETEAPQGYNKLATPIKVVIDSNTDSEQGTDGTGVKNGSMTLKKDDQALTGTEIDVLNQSGTQLPSTGGIGTTIFYVVGGVLVLAAIILLVTKKRMSE